MSLVVYSLRGHQQQPHTHLEGRALTYARAVWLVFLFLAFVGHLTLFPLQYEMNVLMAREQFLNLLPAIDVSASGYSFAIILPRMISVAAVLACCLVVLRYSTEWIAMLMVAALFSATLVSNPAQSIVESRPLLTANLLLLDPLGKLLCGLIMFIYPRGRFQHGWALGLFLLIVPIVIYNGLARFYAGQLTPFNLGVPIVIAVFTIGVVMQFVAIRRTPSPIYRQQSKWLLYSVVMFTVCGASVLLLDPLVRRELGPQHSAYFVFTLLNNLFVYSVISLVAIVGMRTVLHYSAWSVDLALNRGLAYLMMSALIAASYVLLLFGLSYVLQNIALAAVLSAGAAAVSYRPMRRCAFDFIDRRVYGLRFGLEALRRTSAPTLRTGERAGQAFGMFTLEALIGCGSMSEVYRATTDGQPIAVKILRPQMSAEAHASFVREGETLHRLRHPHIVPVYATGEVDGTPYVVMDYVQGQTLDNLIAEHGALPLQDALQVTRAIGAALAAIHTAGYIHRDLKPANIMVRRYQDGDITSGINRATLMDFGLAARIDAPNSDAVIGTIDYMAPEQMQAAGSVGAAADVYALGIILYEMLTGERPFKGNPGQLVFAHLMQPPPDPADLVPTLPPHISLAVMRALAKAPDDRYESAAAFLGALADDPRSVRDTDTAEVVEAATPLTNPFRTRPIRLNQPTRM